MQRYKNDTESIFQALDVKGVIHSCNNVRFCEVFYCSTLGQDLVIVPLYLINIITDLLCLNRESCL